MVLVDSRLGWNEAPPRAAEDVHWENAVNAAPELPMMLMNAVQTQTRFEWMRFRRYADAVGLRALGTRPIHFFIHHVSERKQSYCSQNGGVNDEHYLTFLITTQGCTVDDAVLLKAAHVPRAQCPGLLFHLARISGRAIPAPVIMAMLAGFSRQENILGWLVQRHVPQNWVRFHTEHIEDVIRALLWATSPGDDTAWTAAAVIERRNLKAVACLPEMPRRMVRYRACLSALKTHLPDWYPSEALLYQLWSCRDPCKLLSPLFQYERIGHDDRCLRLVTLVMWDDQEPDDATHGFLVRQVGGPELTALLPRCAEPLAREEAPQAAAQLAAATRPQSGWDPFFGPSFNFTIVAVQ
jgi:hypothetical protein